MFIRADFNGVLVDLNRFGIPVPAPGRTLYDIKGANSTPANMLMTPMLPMYPTVARDAVLTEHAERGYTHFIVCSGDHGSMWNFGVNGFSWTPTQYVEWCRYIKSWGFYVIEWGPPSATHPYYRASVDAGVIDWFGFGVENDSHISPDIYESQLDQFVANVGHGIPIAAHFTANYPVHLPRELYLRDWSKYDGKVHLFWQADQNVSAGEQAAMLYYARQRVNMGLIGGVGPGAPHSLVYAFETMASAQLMGHCGEPYGNLRDLELLYAPRRDGRIAPMGGFGNGCRLPDGSPI